MTDENMSIARRRSSSASYPEPKICGGEGGEGAEVARTKGSAPSNDAHDAAAERYADLNKSSAAPALVANPPPSASFNPFTASDQALENAFRAVVVNGMIPLEAAKFDGGAEFRRNIVEAMLLRSNRGDDLIASYANDPGHQRMLLERDLRRLGDTRTCGATESNADLIAQRAELLRKRFESDQQKDRTKHITVDGHVGTLQSTIDYEMEQRLKAMRPSTGTGALAAGLSAARGESIEDIRKKGGAADHGETLGSVVAGVDMARIGKPQSQVNTRPTQPTITAEPPKPPPSPPRPPPPAPTTLSKMSGPQASSQRSSSPSAATTSVTPGIRREDAPRCR